MLMEAAAHAEVERGFCEYHWDSCLGWGLHALHASGC